MSVSKRVFILMGNPDTKTLSGAFADAYEAGALEAGHEVRRLNISEMKFDPILHKGYREIQELEPDLKTFQENVQWCNHFVLIYPNWWCGTPALLKGLFDRAWLPGFAFNFHENIITTWSSRLKGRSARLIILANVNPWITWLFFGEFTNEMSRATLGFAGFRPVRVKIFSPTEKSSEAKRARWFNAVRNLGRRAI